MFVQLCDLIVRKSIITIKICFPIKKICYSYFGIKQICFQDFKLLRHLILYISLFRLPFPNLLFFVYFNDLIFSIFHVSSISHCKLFQSKTTQRFKNFAKISQCVCCRYSVYVERE